MFEYPLTIDAEAEPFVLANGLQLAEDLFPSAYDPGVRVASLRGVDAAHLVLADLDLWECLFADGPPGPTPSGGSLHFQHSSARRALAALAARAVHRAPRPG
ncbi:hypothetical protein [Streptomyces pseudogriseolus]|uniref:hypothetical protein n=1 Tax=Streptomyces pseudogriseolus TaxID=36817 RepID=UPI003FA341D0